MIDVTRWVLVEAWLSLGLRMRWSLSYEARSSREWIEDDDTRLHYCYGGHGEWLVERRHDQQRSLGYPANDVPQLGTDTMRHELAHYLSATPEQRGQVNFGLTSDDRTAEERALEAEAVLDAAMRACENVVAAVMTGSQRRGGRR